MDMVVHSCMWVCYFLRIIIYQWVRYVGKREESVRGVLDVILDDKPSVSRPSLFESQVSGTNEIVPPSTAGPPMPFHDMEERPDILYSKSARAPTPSLRQPATPIGKWPRCTLIVLTIQLSPAIHEVYNRCHPWYINTPLTTDHHTITWHNMTCTTSHHTAGGRPAAENRNSFHKCGSPPWYYEKTGVGSGSEGRQSVMDVIWSTIG